MPGKYLVIVESPTKAKTIGKFLGGNYIVRASNGHIRDLPNSAAEIPPKLKKEPWAKLGVNVDLSFEPLYIIPKSKKEQVKALKEDLKKADQVLLATDEDREGESISWHLVEALRPKVPVQRMVFHEITKDAIQKALSAPREIDLNLVRAQETRRIVDRLFGYEVSPLLWKKMAPRLSAGRVQSVAVRLLVERERERIRFRSGEYWGLQAKFSKVCTDDPSSFDAELTHLNGTRIATGRDFDPSTGTLKNEEKLVLLNETSAGQLKNEIQNSSPTVQSLDEKPFTSTPPAPFVTSSLQQEANRKLRLSAKRTMSIAQQLYENGYITYMRTDSTTLSEQALTAARRLIEKDFGKEYLPQKARHYSTKVKNAQEAHEAIRPAGENFTPIKAVEQHLGSEAGRLYELIWKRTVASQMPNAQGKYLTAIISAGPALLRSTGKTISFPGFIRAYVEGSDDPQAELADQERTLPKLEIGESLAIEQIKTEKHSTQPPPRYTEGSLIKELEKRGIGRPSTWASIVELVLTRQYAFKKGTALVPTFTAMAVLGMLEKHFATLLDYEFTARLEDDLDEISRGEATNLSYLKKFYFGNGFPGLKALVKMGESNIDPRDVCKVTVGSSEEGKELEVRIGKFGPFITDGQARASLPDDLPPDELTVEHGENLLLNSTKEPESLGLHPETGEEIYLKNGPYGPYVQLGIGTEGKKPKMSSLLPGMSLNDLTLDQAVRLLSLPRKLGKHPDNGNEIIAANGRFGPYIKCGTDTRSIPASYCSPIDIDLQKALELLSQPKGRGANTSKPVAVREIGTYPQTNATIVLFTGRYGPYVSDGTVNASLPKDIDQASLTLEQAIELIEQRREKGDIPRPKRGKKRASARSK